MGAHAAVVPASESAASSDVRVCLDLHLEASQMRCTSAVLLVANADWVGRLAGDVQWCHGWPAAPLAVRHQPVHWRFPGAHPPHSLPSYPPGGLCAFCISCTHVLAPPHASHPRCLPAHYLGSILPSRSLISICYAQSCSALLNNLRSNLLQNGGPACSTGCKLTVAPRGGSRSTQNA